MKGTGAAIACSWDGRDANGAVVPDGAYTVQVLARMKGAKSDEENINIT
ncbi:MAG: hypothetical protein HYZ67_06345, partial [Chlamydiae bacterium]|nr:hypothetical protein [Chlamydiota bacterium]